MKVAILLPGVSPDDFPTRDGYDLVVAIDAAGHAFAADWWLVSGADVFEAKHPKGSPGLFTTADVERQIGHGLERARLLELPEGRLKRYEPLWERYPAALGWSLYPAAAAVVLAASLGATSIDLVGHQIPVEGRAEWCVKCEVEVMLGLGKHLGGKGVDLRVVMPAPTQAPSTTQTTPPSAE